MTNALDRIAPPAAPQPRHLGQATAVEQSRAVAEVQAAVVVAQQRPRDIATSIREMRQSCQIETMAQRAFWRYTRAGKPLTGPTVHLMRELARCFGNVQYAVAELRRDDTAGISEMQAVAWDLQTNTRSALVFVVPHLRDKTEGGPVPLEMSRDIYENNANQGARRLREAIRSILPPWYVEEAMALCHQTLANPPGGKTLPQRVADAIKAFEGLGISVERLEDKLDRSTGKWTPHDLAQLTVTFTSLQRGEITVEEEFPQQQRVTVEEITRPQTDDGAADQSSRPVPPRAEPAVPPGAAPSSPDAGDADTADNAGGVPRPSTAPASSDSSHTGATHREGSPVPARGHTTGGRRQPGEPVPVAPPTGKGAERSTDERSAPPGTSAPGYSGDGQGVDADGPATGVDTTSRDSVVPVAEEGSSASTPPQTGDGDTPANVPAGEAADPPPAPSPEGEEGAPVGGVPAGAPSEPRPERRPAMIRADDREAIRKHMERLRIEDRAGRLRVLSVLTGREIGSAGDLYRTEATAIKATLAKCEDSEQVRALLHELEQARGDEGA
ncbi:MAG TPA: hypothetical protein VK736_10490 [Candidatus Binatia bacterium]|nr:hypothetical protein [Candidatus Binatia bacterium]